MRGGFRGKADAQFAIGDDTAGDEQRLRTEVFRGREGLALEIVNDSALERGDEAKGLFVTERESQREIRP
jgi:hypothetical protein